MNSTRVFSVTKKNIKRNKWLTFSTILVTTIVFTLSSLFISVSILSQKAAEYYQQRAQVIVFFKKGTPEEDIFTFKNIINDTTLIKEIVYVSQDEALNIYRDDFADNPDLISTVTADSLPASLEIRANDINSLISVIELVNKAKETNAYVDEVMYFKDVVDNMRTLSNIVRVGSIVLISAMGLVTISLIKVTIGFNIKLHQEEIEIMHLVGSPDKFIRTPFLIEGTLYGFVGGLLSSLFLLVPWYILIYYTKGTDFALWINQFLTDIGLPFLANIDIAFILIYILVHTLIGSIFGFLSSLSSVKKYLKE